MAFVEAEGLVKVYNPGLPDEVRALDRVSLRVERGEVVVLKGPSGSGKTSLLSLVGCMSRPTAGSILVDGRDVAKLPERFLTRVRRDTFGFIFQQFHLVRAVSVLENVMLPLYPTGTRPAAMVERAGDVLERLRIHHRRGTRAGNLSGGEQQRVAIARALINDPQVVIADEPTAHLDTELAAELLEILGDLNREGRTVVVATHDPFVHEHPLVSRTVSMRDGRVEGAA